LKIFHNIKTQWILMLVLVKHMLAKYKSLVVKMGDNLVRNAIAKNNYKLLCDCDIVLGLICVLPMLEAIPSWPKVEVHLYVILSPLSLSLLLIYMQCMWTHWKDMITSNFKCSTTWWLTFVMVFTWCGIWSHKHRVSMLHFNSMIVFLCCTIHVIILGGCLWWLWKMGKLMSNL
jgi:hypothetical protein